MVDDFPLKIYFAIIFCVSKKFSTFQFYIFEILIFHKNFKQEKYGKNPTWASHAHLVLICCVVV